MLLQDLTPDEIASFLQGSPFFWFIFQMIFIAFGVTIAVLLIRFLIIKSRAKQPRAKRREQTEGMDMNTTVFVIVFFTLLFGVPAIVTTNFGNPLVNVLILGILLAFIFGMSFLLLRNMRGSKSRPK